MISQCSHICCRLLQYTCVFRWLYGPKRWQLIFCKTLKELHVWGMGWCFSGQTFIRDVVKILHVLLTFHASDMYLLLFYYISEFEHCLKQLWICIKSECLERLCTDGSSYDIVDVQFLWLTIIPLAMCWTELLLCYFTWTAIQKWMLKISLIVIIIICLLHVIGFGVKWLLFLMNW